MSKQPKFRSPEDKLNIAIEAIRGDKTIVQLGSEHGIHPKQIQRWRDQLFDEGHKIFINKNTLKSEDPGKEALLHVINQLTRELEFLKKKLTRNP